MEGMDLRKYQREGEDADSIKNIFGKILSGKEGYETVLDENKPDKKCDCGWLLEGGEKFCPECGKKLVCNDTNTNCEIE